MCKNLRFVCIRQTAKAQSPPATWLPLSGAGLGREPCTSILSKLIEVNCPARPGQLRRIGVKIVNSMRTVLFTVLLVGVVNVAPADACKCTSPSAPCAEYWQVAAVFAGTAREIRPVPDRQGVMAVRFDVDRRGRGVNSASVVVESEPQNGGNCGFTFRVGVRYVVYAQATPGGQLTTSMCSGTKPVTAAATDLAFLDEVTGSPRGVRVFGRVRRMEYELISFNRAEHGVAGARVRVTGEGTSREATTPPDGTYDFRDLPPGTYTLRVTPPKGLAFAGPPLPRREHYPSMRPFTLTNPSECVESWPWLLTDAQITGVLLNADGRPAAGKAIDLIAAANASRADKLIPHVSVRTDADGRFTFAFIAPGKYLVGVNLKNPPRPSQLDRRSYHPGVATPAQATVVTVVPESRVRLTPFHQLDGRAQPR
jgi:hypothetical protein